MCGIFGWSFQRRARVPAGQREALASTLGIANSLRGDQSWGAYYQGADGKPHVRREVGDIAAVAGLGSLGLWDTLMAHTRYATTGRITKENQHPFRAGHVLLAHNGMVFNHEELNAKYQRHCNVDSQHFAEHLSAGLDFKDIEAYGSIEWIETETSRVVKLCRMRNGVLTVYGIKNAKGKQVGCVWSSDAEHLRSAIGAARLDAFPYVKLKEGHVYSVRGGKLFESAQRLMCSAPSLDAQLWDRYRRTQTGGHGDKVIVLHGSTGAGEGSLTGSEGDTRTQLDVGLHFNHTTGELEDTSESLDAPPCGTCGGSEGYTDLGECKGCGVPSDNLGNFWPAAGASDEERTKRIREMTDDEWREYVDREYGRNYAG